MKPRRDATKAQRTEIATVRLTPELDVAALVVAKLTSRTRSSLLEHALNLYILKNYPLAFSPNVKIKLSLIEAPEEN